MSQDQNHPEKHSIIQRGVREKGKGMGGGERDAGQKNENKIQRGRN